MKRKYSSVYHILLFIFIQLAWFSILGLWIARFVTNNIIFRRIGERYAVQIEAGGAIAIFIIGLVLLVAVYVMISLIFRRLSVHYKLTRLYDNFIANITHELKTPLASIQLYLDTLRHKNLPPEKRTRFIDLMEKDASRLGKLINTILNIAQMEMDQKFYQCEIVDADKELRAIAADIKVQLQLSDTNLSISGQTGCQCIMDKEALRIVLDNLVNNSIKYARGTPKIKIRLSCDQKWYVVDYRDYGIGLPAGEHKKIFNKFYRVKRSDIPSVKGTGLGLFWVREIIAYHGGKIGIVAHEAEQGTHFRIELPSYPETKRRYLTKLLKQSNSA